ncbi:Conserved_hypothetical protein [Hexamita inflata]|uniref:Uncharacterized protein n=1 Tax=Hexamita inflata TaxID=28002 RepID=A0AA86QQ49_9EUKA|nr:Conserved hypothetical protein [Hexamita inflata]
MTQNQPARAESPQKTRLDRNVIYYGPQKSYARLLILNSAGGTALIELDNQQQEIPISLISLKYKLDFLPLTKVIFQQEINQVQTQLQSIDKQEINGSPQEVNQVNQDTNQQLQSSPTGQLPTSELSGQDQQQPAVIISNCFDLALKQPAQKYLSIYEFSQSRFNIVSIIQKQLQSLNNHRRHKAIREHIPFVEFVFDSEFLNQLTLQVKNEQYLSIMRTRNRFRQKTIAFEQNLVQMQCYPNAQIVQFADQISLQALQYIQTCKHQFVRKLHDRAPKRTRFTSIYMLQEKLIISFLQLYENVYELPQNNVFDILIQQIKKLENVYQQQNSKDYEINFKEIYDLYNNFQKTITKVKSYAHLLSIMQLNAQPLFIILITLSTYMMYFTQQSNGQIPNIQKLFLTFTRAIQSKTHYFSDQLVQQFIKTQQSSKLDLETFTYVEGPNMVDVTPTIKNNKLEMDLDVEKILCKRQQQISYLEYLQSNTFQSYFQDFSITDEMQIICKNLYNIKDFYIANVMEVQDESQFLQFSYFENEQVQQMKKNLYESKCDLQENYQLDKDDLVYLKQFESSVQRLKIETYKSQFNLSDNQLPKLKDKLNAILNSNTFENIFNSWKINDDQLIKIKVYQNIKPIVVKEAKDFEKMFLFSLMKGEIIFSGVDFEIIKSEMIKLQNQQIIANTIPDSICVDFFRLNIKPIKSHLSNQIQQNATKICEFISLTQNQLLLAIQQQIENFFIQIVQYSRTPDKFHILVELEKTLDIKLLRKQLFRMMDEHIEMWHIISTFVPVPDFDPFKLYDPIIKLISAFIEIQKQCKNRIIPFSKCIMEIDMWFYEQVFELGRRIAQFANITEEDAKLAQGSALQLKEKFLLTCTNVEIKPINLTENVEAAEFVYTLKRFTSLNLFAKQIKIHPDQFEKKEKQNTIKIRQQEQYRKLYLREKITPKNNHIDLNQVVGELFYLSSEYLFLYKTVNVWRVALQKLEKTDDLKSWQNTSYPSPGYLLQAIVPLYQIMSCYKELKDQHIQYQSSMINEYPIAQALQNINKVSGCIQIIKERITEPFQVLSNLFEMGKTLNNAESIAFSIDFVNYQYLVKEVETFIQEFSLHASLIYLIQQVKKDSTFNVYLESLIQDFHVKEVINQYSKDQVLLDQVYSLYRLSSINNQAKQVLDDIQFTLKLYTIETKYRTYNRSPAKVFDLNSCKHAVDQLIVTPNNYQDFCNQSLHQLSLIINRKGFVDEKQIKHDNIIEKILDVANFDMSYIEGNQQLIRLYFEYTPAIQQQCRDLELILNNSLLVFQSISRIPYIILELLTIVQDGQLITYTGGKINDVEYQPFSVNVLSQKDCQIIHNSSQQWIDTVNYNFSKPVALQTLSINTNLIGQLTQLCQQLDYYHVNLYKNKCQQILVSMTSFYNKNKNTVESNFDLNYELDGSSTPKLLIPFYNNKQLTQALIFPTNFTIFFGEFPNDRNIFKNIPTLTQEIFQNMSDFMLSTDSKQLCGLISGSEKLVFEEPIKCPNLDYIVLDMATEPMKLALEAQAGKAADEFQIVLNSYISKAENAINQLNAYVNKYPFQILWIGISTVQRQRLNKNIGLAFVQRFTIHDYDVDIQLFQDLPKQFQTDSITAKANKARADEFICVLKDITTLFTTFKGLELLTADYLVPLTYYDPLYKQIYSSPHMGGFSLVTGGHWLGQPTLLDIETSYKSSQQMINLSKMLRGVHEQLPLILLGSSEQQYKNPELQVNLNQISRYSCRRHIILPISGFNFALNLQKCASFLLSGYIVCLTGVEFLPKNQLLEVVNLSTSLYNRRGPVPGIVRTSFKMKNVQFNEMMGTEDYAQQVIDMKDAKFEDFPAESIGALIIFLPSLETEETVQKFHYEEITTKLQNGSSMQKIFVANMQANQIIQEFENKQVVQLEINEPIFYFTQKSPEFAKQFFEVHSYLCQLDNLQPKLQTTDIPFILGKAKDKSNAACVAVITLDYLLHQFTSVMFDSNLKQGSSLLADVVSAAFGLDESNAVSLKSMAEDFILFENQQLYRLGYKKLKSPKITSFNEYFEDLKKYGSQQFLYYVNLFSQIHNFPLQLIYDILYTNELLKLQVPILALCPQSSYSRVFMSILAAVKNWQLFYVINEQCFSQALKIIQAAEDKREALIGIAPASIDMLLAMMDQILGLFTQKQAIREKLNLTTYIQDPSKGPYILLFLDANLASQFKKSKYMQLFKHKVMLLPCNENSSGAKKLLLRVINLNEQLISKQIKLDRSMIYDKLQLSTLTAKSTLSQFIQQKITLQMFFDKQFDQQVKLAESRLFGVRYLLTGFINYFYVGICKMFNVGKSVEETILIRSLMSSFLERFNVTSPQIPQLTSEIAKQISEFQSYMKYPQQRIGLYAKLRQPSLGGDAMTRLKVMIYFIIEQMKAPQIAKQKQTKEETDETARMYYADTLTINKTYVTEEIQPFIDIGGFYNKDINKFDLDTKQIFYKTQKLPEILAESSIMNAEQQYTDVGQGICGSIMYNLNYDFVYKTLIEPKTHSEAFSQFLSPFLVSLWNACSCYSQVLNQKHDTSKKLYEQFLTQNIDDLGKIEVNELALMVPASILMAQELKIISSMNIEQLMDIMTTTSYLKLKQLNHGLNAADITKVFKSITQLVIKQLPVQTNDCINYINYANQIFSFQEYKLSQGIFKNISELSDAKLVQKSIKMQENDIQEHSSIQNISDIPIYFDQIRVATSFLISAAMQSAVSVAVVGQRAQGKSTLIDVARLMCKEIVDFNNLILNSTQTPFSVMSTINAITRQFQLKNYKNTQKSRYYNNKIPDSFTQDYYILDYNKSMAFPSFQIHLSDNQDTMIHDQLALLVRDHMINISTMELNGVDIQLDNSCHSVTGLITLSDCSLVVECLPQSTIIQYCPIVIDIPDISEQFLNNYFKQLYPEQSEGWNNSFIQGYFLIKNSIPHQIADNFTVIQKMFQNNIYLMDSMAVKQASDEINKLNEYSNRRIETNEPPTTVLLEKSADLQIMQSNIHALFFALRSIGCVTSQILTGVIDRLASLTILGYLAEATDSTSTPWSDANIMLTGMFSLYSTWQSQIINQSLKTNKPELDLNTQLIQHLVQTQQLLVQNLSKSITNNTDLELKYQHIIKNYTINPFWFGHIIEVSKQFKEEYDPLALSRSFEMFLRVAVQQEEAKIRSHCLLEIKQNTLMKKCLTGLQSIDCFETSRQNFINQNQKQEQQQYIGIEPLVTINYVLAQKPPRYYLNLLNATSGSYQQVIKNISAFSDYKSLRNDHTIGDNIVFDIQDLLQQLDQDSKVQDNMTLIQKLQMFNKKLQQNNHTSTHVMLIMILTLLRITIGMCCGVQPDVWLEMPVVGQETSLNKLLGLPLNSQLQVSSPSNCIEGGQKLLQIPLEHCGSDDVKIRMKIATEETQVHTTQQTLQQKYAGSKKSIIVVIPKSLLDLQSPTGASVLTIISNTLNPFNSLVSLFSLEELQFILDSSSNQVLSSRQLSTILAERYTLLMISDDPSGSQIQSVNNKLSNHQNEYVFDFQKLQAVGSIKNPILEFIQSIINYKDIIPKDEFREAKHKIQAYNIKMAVMPLKIVDPLILRLQKRMDEAKYNLVNMNKSSMDQLYRISGCVTPQQFNLPKKINLDYNIQQQQFSLAVIQIYDFMVSQAKGPCVSLSQFSKTASDICNALINRCSDFFKTMNNIFLAYRLYFGLSNQQAKQQPINIMQFSLDQYILLVGSDPKLANQNEATILRDYIFSVIDQLKDNFQCYKCTTEMAHFDAICIAAQLYFGINDLISEDHAYSLIANSFTNEMEEWYLKMIDEYAQGNDQMSSFNLLVTAIMNQNGFKLILRQPKLLQEDDKEIQYQSNILAQNALQQSQFLFLSHFCDTTGYDWPLFITAKMLKIKWEPNDVSYRQLMALCSFCQIGKTGFFISNYLATAAAILIESIKQGKIQPRYFYSIGSKVVEEPEDKESSAKQFIEDMMKRFVQIDLMIPPHEFDAKVAKALSAEDCTIVFTNFGSSGANNTNISTMTKFLRLRQTRLIQKRQIIQIRNVTTIVNNALHNYTIIVAVAPQVNVIIAMKQCGLLTQEIMDDYAICTSYGVSDFNKDKDKTQENIQIMQEQILQGCYGDIYSKRATVERIRLSNMGLNTMSSVCSQSIFQFVKRRLQSIDKTLKENELDYNYCSQLVNKYTEKKNIVDSLSKLSMLKDNNEKLKEELTDMFKLFLRLGYASYANQDNQALNIVSTCHIIFIQSIINLFRLSRDHIQLICVVELFHYCQYNYENHFLIIFTSLLCHFQKQYTSVITKVQMQTHKKLIYSIQFFNAIFLISLSSLLFVKQLKAL